MIDIENLVINAIETAVKTRFPNAYCCSDYVETPASFPCVSIVEEDNYTYTRTLDNSLTEHHANISYLINVYSNSETGKKAQAKEIANIIDEQMQNMKFTRMLKQPIPNRDRNIYRITMRYTGIVATAQQNGQNLIYQMYRR